MPATTYPSTKDRHEGEPDLNIRHDDDDDILANGPCRACGRTPAEVSGAIVFPPEEPSLPESLVEAGQELVEALDAFARELHRAGARDSDHEAVRHFSSYHLADIEGNDSGAGWLASNLMADALRALLRDGEEE